MYDWIFLAVLYSIGVNTVEIFPIWVFFSADILCFLRCGDVAVIGAPPVAQAGRLVGAVCCTVTLVIERGGQVWRGTVLKRKGPGLMSLSGVALLYDGVVNRLDGAQLARVFPELLSLERGFLSLVCSVGSSGRCRICLVGSTESLVHWLFLKK